MDPILGGALATGATSALSSLLNAGANRNAQRYNSQQAKINREFQADMSNTAYQRSMKDMERAGLNPILLFGGGGASTPAGSGASTAPTQHDYSELGRSVNSGLQLNMQKQLMEKEIDVKDETIDNIKANTEKTKAETLGETLDQKIQLQLAPKGVYEMWSAQAKSRADQTNLKNLNTQIEQANKALNLSIKTMSIEKYLELTKQGLTITQILSQLIQNKGK